MGRRTQAERDEATVEIGFALFVATSLAGAAFVAVTAPVHFFGVTSPSEHTLNRVGAVVAATVFVASVVTILVRHRRAGRRRVEQLRADQSRAAQPSQPGRTKPDS
ncbi:DUF6332 family protein [Streptomyces sp. NPDC050844]|uniref:DUF6332 family protein n=1 Tax=Streptomyces sp. NPDC050844 TaxID=3155790 RepID=UPI0033E53243